MPVIRSFDADGAYSQSAGNDEESFIIAKVATCFRLDATGQVNLHISAAIEYH